MTIKRLSRRFQIHLKAFILMLIPVFFGTLFIPSSLLAQEGVNNNNQPIKIIQKNTKGQTIFMIEYKLDSSGKKISGIEHIGTKDFPLVYKYDSRGRLIQEKKGDETKGDIVEITDYTYNENGSLSTKTHYFLYPDGEKIVIEELKYRYDSSGNLVFESSMSSGLKTIREYQYNSTGNRTSGLIRGEQKGPMAELQYSYTDSGLLKEVISKQPQTGELLWHESYIYDNRGRLIREEHRFGEVAGKPPIVKLYQYNEQGKKVKETYLVGDEVQLEVLYEY